LSLVLCFQTSSACDIPLNVRHPYQTLDIMILCLFIFRFFR
jgi:hypothetical protein